MPAELRGFPCETHSCAKCCYDTEMPLTEADIARIEALGHRREDFSALDDDSVPQLRNDSGHCVFLVRGRCSIYDARPEGCRLYPLVWSADERRVVRDDFCPFTHEFPKTPQQEAAVRRVLATLEREATARRQNAPKPPDSDKTSS